MANYSKFSIFSEKKLLIVLMAIICNIAIISWLFSNYVVYLANFHNGMTDANEYIKRGIEIVSFDRLVTFPHYYSRSLPYMIFGIKKFPPNFNEALQVIIFNVLISYLILYSINIEITKFYGIQIELWKRFLIPAALLNVPGLIFLNATFRPEIPNLLLLFFYLKIILNDKNSPFLYIITLIFSPFMRLSQPLSTIFVFFLKFDLIKNKNKVSLLKYFIFLNIFIASIITFTELSNFSYLEGGWYAFYDYGNTIRGFFNIKEISDLYLLPIRTSMAYILDSMSILVWKDAFNNPENFNNIASTCRVLILIFIIFLFIKRKISYNDKVMLCLYLCITIPVISTIGFYQTRYLLIPDLILYYIIFLKIISPKKISD